MKPIRHVRSRAAVRWLKVEAAEQQRRYRSLVAAQALLATRRSRWITQFLARIQARGGHVDGAERRRVRPEEIPLKPRRRLRVVS